MARKKNKKGFTLIELIVVIAIIGILSAVIVPSYLGFVEKAKLTSDKHELSEIVRAIEYANIMGPVKIEDVEPKATVSVVIKDNGLEIKIIGLDKDNTSFQYIINAIYKAKNNTELEGQVEVDDGYTIIYYRNQSKNYSTYDFATGSFGVSATS